ncbi:disease resistance-like protein DSC1 [Citrus clementina]|uniref:disease resistance-like protein DSC1 n=1 Tax=Citrus clementina TaxID=85681 RepID=UPI000CED7285|nr:disease resistance-like protein DSC1 [Citrus x clementina]
MASSSSSCNYDVFLSFRGEDTRENFTSHLYAALCGKKIKTFIDEDLNRGDEISPALMKAIEGSKISVIIFSKDYASSKWCLNELVKILKCKNLKGQTVIPIYYHVSPSDVRKQTGTFGEGFVKLEQQFKEKAETVRKWRDAMIKTSYLSGHESTKIRPEAKLVQVIVNDILKKLECKSISSDSSKGLVGLNSRIECIKSLLCVGFPDVRIVGIWGMGGIGKTTLAKALFNQVSNEFEGNCFIENVREEIENGVGLVHLHKQVVSLLLGERIEMGGPNIPAYTLERLQRTKVFIVLDDVSEFEQLKYFVGWLHGFCPGSRIVVTTRDKQVLRKHGVNDEHVYEVERLSEDEGLELFYKYAFRQSHCPEHLTALSKKAVRYAEGNPLALEVLGSSLHQKSKQDWENVLDNLKQISGVSRIYNVLRISYEELSFEEKSIFLDIACFFKGECKDRVLILLHDRQYNVTHVLSILIDKSLITEHNNRLHMHELLQEMGQEIVRQEDIKEPGKRSRLWHHKDVRHVLKHNEGTNAIEGIFLNLAKIKGINLDSRAFTNMSSLRVLKFYIPEGLDMSFEEQHSDSKVQFPDGLDYLPEKLKYLHLHKYPLRTLPENFKPKNLIELNLPFSKIVQIWEGKKKAFKLKSINLSHSQYLIRIPDPSETPSLERINLWNCTNLAWVPSSIQNFNHLSLLCFQGCKNLRSFPSNLHFVSPVNIDCSFCVNLTEFPRISGNITKLNLCDTAIEEVPSSVECLTNLEYLYINRCKRLKRVSTSICKLKSLIWLCLNECLNLESFPESSEKINLGRTTVTELPPSFENLEGLGTLGLESWSELGNLKSFQYIGAHGSTISQLPHLLSHLVSLHASLLSGLSSLNWLNLNNCALTAIPEEIGCLPSLEWLELRGNNFESLPVSIKQLSRLKRLDLSNCSMLQSIPELPPSLKWLQASNCKRLQFLPEIPSRPEELDASLLQKLSKYSYDDEVEDVNVSSSIKFLFVDCIKMYEEESKKNLADSQLRIQHMAVTSLRLFYELQVMRNSLSFAPLSRSLRFVTSQIMIFILQERYKLRGTVLILPGSEIPEWFSNQNSGSEITLQLPRHCCQNLIGFALCVVLVWCDPEWSGFNIDFRYSFEMTTLSGRKHVRRRCFKTLWFVYPMTKIDHVVLGFNPCGNVGFPDDNHLTTVSFDFFSIFNKVSRCGVCPVYANPNGTNPNTFTLNFATEVWKLDDMASARGTSDEEELEPSPKRICRDDQINTP